MTQSDRRPATVDRRWNFVPLRASLFDTGTAGIPPAGIREAQASIIDVYVPWSGRDGRGRLGSPIAFHYV
jgi:hypothetical protein